ncbi:50S ribosomal protein L11 methyltransferase [Flammeovirga agarivorans]|uniref:Ribosomal protein L11 methyltransferase n=1 Tax=Flammeovirga agarivorans TaxID=2726742 RepID=A0A7X8XX99_9BACT|nr:50S ribosomal protein L11 methyltransferase [Flammeovirga agarivorans]NLR93047.1 50S ribosomal protein L11 methyltransferase [Flammeovirga agarivorans]
MKYVVIKVKCSEEMSEVVQAILGNIGFDAFLENETGFEASIESNLFNEEEMKEALSFFDDQITYDVEEQEKQNWNKLWESHYNPVEISEDLQIRASFHPKDPKYKYEIVITPKMSFGTGHHATTTLMLRNQLMIDHQDKNVADLGCGTGILAVMAKLLGAKQVDACDIEDWSCENALENAALNNVDVRVTCGTVNEMEKLDQYEIVLANINRNVLLSEMPTYQGLLVKNGKLLLSGFYTEDLPIIKDRCKEVGLTYVSHLEKDNWVSAVFEN